MENPRNSGRSMGPWNVFCLYFKPQSRQCVFEVFGRPCRGGRGRCGMVVLLSSSPMLHADHLLTRDGDMRSGAIAYDPVRRELSADADRSAGALTKPYIVEGLPIDVHVHGIGHLDFSRNAREFDLHALERLLAEEGVI